MSRRGQQGLLRAQKRGEQVSALWKRLKLDVHQTSGWPVAFEDITPDFKQDLCSTFDKWRTIKHLTIGPFIGAPDFSKPETWLPPTLPQDKPCWPKWSPGWAARWLCTPGATSRARRQRQKRAEDLSRLLAACQKMYPVNQALVEEILVWVMHYHGFPGCVRFPKGSRKPLNWEPPMTKGREIGLGWLEGRWCPKPEAIPI